MEPYDLIFQWSNWYVWGWCLMRQDFRLFKLNRITELEIGDGFEKQAVPLPDLTIGKRFPCQYQVKARIRPEFKWRLVEDYGPGYDSQLYRES